MKARWIICILYAFSCNFGLMAQVDFSHVFSNVFATCHEKNSKEKYKGQILKGKRSGMGYILYKNGSVYAGDFYRGKPHGFGILMSSVPKENECMVYSGFWKEGRKSGKATCYGGNGLSFYSGLFENDLPKEQLPIESPEDPKIFLSIEIGNGDFFLGEFQNDNANGYGIYIFKNGDIWQGRYKDGQRKGVGLYLTSEGEWETINYQGADGIVISTSEQYRNIDAMRKAYLSKALLESVGYMKEAVNLICEQWPSEKIDRTVVSTDNVSHDVSIQSPSSSQTGTSKTKDYKKCRRCRGSGKCEAYDLGSYKDKCRGSKKCQYCLGDGFNYVSGHKVKCVNCYHPGRGDCQYCKGTGICSLCNGKADL